MTLRPEPEALLRETTWVRRFAASLIADRDLADDVTQEAMVAAWQGAPAGDGRRPWLASVVKRLAARARRATFRRAAREREAARPEALPSTAELAARAEFQRSAVAAVLALDEPYRGTLLLRFVHGADYATIATQQGVATETVRSRIKRGLALVRARLDRAHGSRRAWTVPLLVPLVGLPAEVAATEAPGSGIVVMSTGKKLVAALAVAMVALAAWMTVRSDGAPPADRAPTVPEAILAATTVAAPATQPGTDPGVAAQRAPVAEPAGFALVGRVICEETGAPLPARVTVCTDRGFDRTVVEGLVDAKGRFRVVLTPDVRTWGDYLAASADEHATVRTRILGLMRERETGDVDLGEIRLPVGTRMGGRVVDAERHTVAAAELFLAQGECLDTARPVGRSAADGAFVLAEHVAPGTFRNDNDLGNRTILIAIAAQGVGWLELDPTQRRSEQGDLWVTLAPSAELRVAVRDAEGRPVSGAKVTTAPQFAPLASRRNRPLRDSAAEHFSAHTDATGAARVMGLPVSAPGLVRDAHATWLGGSEYRVNVSAEGYPPWQRDALRLAPGGAPLEVTLAAPEPRLAATLTGWVRDRQGNPIAGATIAEQGRREGATAGADGRFEYEASARARPGVLHVAVRAARYATQFAVVALDAGATTTSHDFALERGVDLAGRVVDQAGRPVPNCSLWVADATGQNLLLDRVRSDVDGRFVLASMPAAKLTLRTGAPSASEGRWDGPDAIEVDAGTTREVTLTLTWHAWPRTRVHVEVFDAGDGSAADIADVEARPLDPSRSRYDLPVIDRRPGGVTVSRLASGRWRLRVAAQGNRRGVCEFDLPTDDTELRLRCVVARPGSILGTVAYDADVPEAQRRVGAIWTLPFSAGRYVPQPGQQGVQGTRGFIPVAALVGRPFVLDDIDPDTEVTLWANDGFVWARASVTVPGATEVPFTLALHFGGAMRVLLGPGLPREGITVALEPIGHAAPSFELFGQREGEEIALAPGRWRWRASWPGGPDPGPSGEIEVVRGVLTDVTIGR